MIRLAHYPQNEHIVRLAEKMGFLLWEEIPVWQGIDFANDANPAEGGPHDPRNGRDATENRCALTFLGCGQRDAAVRSPRNAFLRHLIVTAAGRSTTRA